MSDDKVIYLKGKHTVPAPDEDREEALRIMKDCLTLVGRKVESEDVDGLIIITFNKDNTSEDYLAGLLQMADVTHVLNCLLINNVLMTQIDVQDMET
jgi:hypothetical protein|tara:strand:+ start:1244 stop:1534 length:291 start_codon:yes stop_codon:yes gene_type:complete